MRLLHGYSVLIIKKKGSRQWLYSFMNAIKILFYILMDLLVGFMYWLFSLVFNLFVCALWRERQTEREGGRKEGRTYVMLHMLRSDSITRESLFSFPHVGPRDWTLVARLAFRHSHPWTLMLIFFSTQNKTEQNN